MPIRIQIVCRFIIIIIMIVRVNFNNLGIYNLFLHSDLISVRLIILRLWILILMKLRQFNNKFIKSLFFMFIILNLSLIFSFRANRILFFYFFFWMVINANFFYYHRMRLSNRAIKIKLLFIDIYFICFVAFINNNIIYLKI